MKISHLIIGLVLFWGIHNACTNKNNIYEYPDIIKQNKLEALYDSAKWVIYSSNYRVKTVYCNKSDTTYKFENKNLISYNLKFDTLFVKGDTIEMEFNFYDKDETEICYYPKRAPVNKVIFIKGDSIVYRMNSSYKYNAEYLSLMRKIENNKTWPDNYSAPYKTEQKAFPKFLQNTKYKLNPWLKAEAVKRGIIEK